MRRGAVEQALVEDEPVDGEGPGGEGAAALQPGADPGHEFGYRPFPEAQMASLLARHPIPAKAA